MALALRTPLVLGVPPVGTIASVRVALSDAGWEFQGPLQFKTAGGFVLHLPSVCPHRVKKLYAVDLIKQNVSAGLRKVKINPAVHNNTRLLSDAVSYEAIANLCNTSALGNRSHIINRMWSNGVMTNWALASLGYEVDIACAKCGEAIDTVHHRLYTCAMAKGSALETLGPALFSEAVASGADDLFFTRLMVPAHQHLAPVKDLDIKYISFEPHDQFSIDKGKVYIDGSCSNPAISCIRRAGFSAVQVGDGGVVAGAYANVPAYLPQTPLMAEACAVSLLYQLAAKGVVGASDCKLMVDAQMGGEQLCTHHSQKTACTWRTICNMRDFDHVSLAKAKAHRSLADVSQDPEDLADFHGNEHADTYAKPGVVLHDLDAAEESAIIKQLSNLRKVATHAVNILKDWPVTPHARRSKVFRDACHAVHHVTVPHNFGWHKRAWRCSGCFRRTRNLSSPSIPPSCDASPHLAELLFQPLEHELWVARVKPAGFIVSCSTCWGYSEVCCRKLSVCCKGPPTGNCRSTFGHTARRGMLNRLHPVTLQPFYMPRRLD